METPNMLPRLASGAITLIILTLARLTATTERAGSRVACSSARDRGTAGAIVTAGATAGTAIAADTDIEADTELAADTGMAHGLDTAVDAPVTAAELMAA